MQTNLRGRGVEAFVVDFAEFTAVHRVAEVRAKARNIEEVHAAADFLVRRKGDADFAVFRRALTVLHSLCRVC